MAREVHYHHLRNASARLDFGPHRLLIDPMLSPVGAMPGFRVFDRTTPRNPTVPLPSNSESLLAEATGIIVTHEHPDHLDEPGRDFIRERRLPVWASSVDGPSLAKKGLEVRSLEEGFEEATVEIVPVRHGRGPLGWLMGHVSGFVLDVADGPTVLFTSDAVASEGLWSALERVSPDVVVAPAGSADMGLGKILFSMEELLELARRAPHRVVFNHLEALDHCPTTRSELRSRLEEEGLLRKVDIPEDGESLQFKPASAEVRALRPSPPRKPDFRKWLTAKMA